MKREVQKHVDHIRKDRHDRVRYFRSLDPDMQMAVFDELTPRIARDLLSRLPLQTLVTLLEHHDRTAAEQIILRVPQKRRRAALALHMRRDLYNKAESIRSLHPDATIELIQTNFVLLSTDANIEDVAEAIDDHFDETGRLPEVLVHKDGHCIGEIPPGSLIRARNVHHIGSLTQPVPVLPISTPPAEIAAQCMNEDIQKIVLVDAHDAVIGIVYAPDVIDLFNEKPAESLFSFAGIDVDERPGDTVRKKFSARYQWLIINLITAFFAGSTIALFEGTLQEITILAMYLPIVASMGGNAGIQTLAIFMRGVALGEVTLGDALPAIKREVVAGILQGLMHGIITGTIAVLLGQGIGLGLVVGTAVFFNLILSAFAGAYIPLILHARGKDPALASGILLTTLTDVFGFVTIFVLATIFLL